MTLQSPAHSSRHHSQPHLIQMFSQSTDAIILELKVQYGLWPCSCTPALASHTPLGTQRARAVQYALTSTRSLPSDMRRFHSSVAANKEKTETPSPCPTLQHMHATRGNVRRGRLGCMRISLTIEVLNLGLRKWESDGAIRSSRWRKDRGVHMRGQGWCARSAMCFWLVL